MIRVYPVQDNDGHWYILPHYKAETFLNYLEKLSSISEEDEEYWDILEFFEINFNQYATGGDLNLIPLYAEEGVIGK